MAMGVIKGKFTNQPPGVELELEGLTLMRRVFCTHVRGWGSTDIVVITTRQISPQARLGG
jgi:hypothetical protein